MIDPRPSFPSLRFVVSPVSPVSPVSRVSPVSPVSRVSRVSRVSPIAPLPPAAHSTAGVHGQTLAAAPRARPLDLPRSEALDLLDWLGLGRPEFGAISARELAPRCRRRLWNIARNAHPSLRAHTAELLSVAEAAGEGMVLFG